MNRTLAPMVLIAVLTFGCGSDPASTADKDAGDATTALDTTAEPQDAGETDTGSVPDIAIDAGPAFDCPGFCDAFTACAADVSTSLCVQLCQDKKTAKPAQKCLTTTADCDAFVDCMLAASLPQTTPMRSFDEGQTGIKFRDLVGDFTVPTERGDWNFKANYDGNDSYVFIFTTKGWFVTSSGVDFSGKLLADSHAVDLKKLLELAPKNTHWFFISYLDKDGTNNVAKYNAAYKAKFNQIFGNMKPLDRAWWKQRLHYVTAPAPIANQAITVPKNLGGWLGQYTQKRAPRYFAIDRYQRLRQVGLLSLVGQSKWYIQHLAYEPQYYNFEVERAKKYPTDGVKEVVLLDKTVHKAAYIDVTFPPAAEMAKYDTLEIDHAQMCKDHDQANCFEWDYIAWLKVAERPVKEGNPYAKESCTVAVKEVLAKAEVVGTCTAGANKDKSCKAAGDCPDGKCSGYKKAVLPIKPVVGDTKPCKCITPRQEEVSRAHACKWTTKPVSEKAGTCDGGANKDKSCKVDGDCPGSTCKGAKTAVTGVSGYGGCGCKTLDLDVQRWITTYRREGHWINDASHTLYHFAKGGTVRFRYKPAYPYTTTLKLRLRNTQKNGGKASGKGGGTPSEVHKLFGGGPFGKTYNDKYKPATFEIPADAKRVEIVVDVTGHGFGKDTANCSEFCNHTHHFSVKGGGGDKTYVRDQPFIGDNYGCAKQVGVGVVPNQFGTWTLGRGGWCPGQEVPLTVWDITKQAKAGSKVTISYQGMLSGKPYVPVAKNASTGGFGGRIDLKSWLMIYK
ncbi:MAG: hypothetical protein KC502_06900 [Myxococcales bacterium]|nr:hypothetical protein [Myxococcales bacterium]